MKRLRLTLLTLGIGGFLSFATQAPAFAQAQVLTGTVYQVEVADVYVEAPDHTAVRVPVDSATFSVNGVATDYTDLKNGSPVTVQYLPMRGAIISRPYVYGTITEVPTAGTIYMRDTMENGVLIHRVWTSGHWIRQ